MNWIFKRKVTRQILQRFLCILLGFLIFDQGGYLAVKNTETGETFQSQIRTEILPSSDIVRLQEGIYCEDIKEAAQVLENFCS